MLKWGKDPGDKDSWEEQGCWERTRMSGRDKVTEREGDSWQGTRLHGEGQRHSRWMRVLVSDKEGWGTRMPGGKRTQRKDKDFQGIEDCWGEEDTWEKQDCLGGTRTVVRDKDSGKGQGEWLQGVEDSGEGKGHLAWGTNNW